MKKEKCIWTYFLVIMSTFYINTSGCKNSNEITPTLIPLSSEPVTDIDGNIYKTVIIGNQIWMAENLKTTKYRNGDPIESFYNINPSIGASCSYGNNAINTKIYGRLYNWHAVMDPRNIAPKGWHIPSNNEWNILNTFLGGQGFAGGKLKEIGTDHWKSPNTGATNETGFTALPGGAYYSSGSFGDFGTSGYWWSKTPSNSVFVWVWVLYNSSGGFGNSDIGNKGDGLSVRCIKD